MIMAVFIYKSAETVMAFSAVHSACLFLHSALLIINPLCVCTYTKSLSDFSKCFFNNLFSIFCHVLPSICFSLFLQKAMKTAVLNGV